MPSDSELTYGQSTEWQPERPRWRVFPLVVSWLATGVALMVAAGLLPGVGIDGFWGALVVAAIVAALNAVIPPVLAALRLPLTLVLGFLLVLIADAGILLVDGRPDRWGAHRRQLRLGAARGARGRGGERRARRPARARMTRTRCASRSGSRAGRGSSPTPTSPGSSSSRSTGLRCPCCAGRCATATPRHGALAGRRHASPDRVGDRSVLADGCQPGGDPARIQRGHLGVPLGGEGDRDADDVLGAAGLRGDRAAACDGHRPARRRRLQPRQPALRRGGGRDPHGQPDGGREAVQSGLSGVSRQRRQRHAHARAVPVRGRPRVDRGRACDPP